jgi:dihydroxyacetone kinase-like protein
MDSLNTEDIKKIFTKVKDIMVDMEDYLFDLDSKMGDGDLGLTMKKGFIKVDEEVRKSNEEDIGKIFIKAGMTLASAAPSTMGTLFATGLIRAGKEVEGDTVVRLSDFSLMFSAFVKGIMERGKSTPGEKTIIDSILPAVDALKKANEDGKDLVQAFNLAYEAAREGLESTKNMTSAHGKAVYHSERSKGTEDPGAAAGMLLLKGFVAYLNILNLDK